MAILRYYYGDAVDNWDDDKILKVYCELLFVKKHLGEWKDSNE